MAYPLDVKEYVSKRLADLPGTWDDKTKAIVAEVKEKFGYSMNVVDGDSLRKAVAYWTKKVEGKINSALDRLNEAVDEKKAYEVDGESVVFHVEKKRPDGTDYVEKYAIPFAELEAIWYDYSNHGKNLS